MEPYTIILIFNYLFINGSYYKFINLLSNSLKSAIKFKSSKISILKLFPFFIVIIMREGDRYMEDEALIREILSGSKSAMELLVKKYYNVVFSYIYRYSGNYHLSCDLTQETFIKMIKAVKSFKISGGKFKSYILKIAVNTCKDYYKNSYYKNVGKNFEEFDDEKISSENVSDFFEYKEDRQKVKKAILNLPDFQREAILLKFYYDMKISEIADITNANESTVKSRIYQGLEKVRKEIERGEKLDKRRKEI